MDDKKRHRKNVLQNVNMHFLKKQQQHAVHKHPANANCGNARQKTHKLFNTFSRNVRVQHILSRCRNKNVVLFCSCFLGDSMKMPKNILYVNFVKTFFVFFGPAQDNKREKSVL